MRGLPSTIALVVIAAALVSYIYFVDAPAPGETREKVFAVEAAAIEALTITSAGETSVLRKVEGTWRMVEPVETEADEAEVTSVTGQLAGLEITRIVDAEATDLAQYGLASPKAAVGFTAGSTTARLLLGDTTPTTTDMYAALEGDARVFLVPAFLESTFARTPFNLRDKRVLRVTRPEVDAVEIAGGGSTIRLTRTGSDWQIAQPYPARGDYGAIEGLVTRLSSAPMASIVAEPSGALASYGLDAPSLTVTLHAGSTSAVLLVGREADGRMFARDQSRPIVFTIDKTLADDLAKPVEEYRTRELFAFRLFNAERVAVTRDGTRVEFERRAGEGEGAAETWHRADGTDTHTSLIEDLVSKLLNLRAESFAGTTASTGLAAPVFVVDVTFDEGKTERVSFGRSASEAFAARSDEPGAARLDTTAFEEALNALTVATAPAPDAQGASR
ncbi:MAG: DUF4340 domain-containing protein [Vicinamibacterales bacterium]|nr:DUF4340 domain-containing protein [Vicinamibacterales bacterium]